MSNLAIGRLLSAYVNDNDEVRTEINRWIGTGSTLGLSDDQIGSFFTIVLSTAASSPRQCLRCYICRRPPGNPH